MRFLGIVLVAFVAFTPACLHNQPNTTPQANVAHYGTDVVNTLSELQQIVIKATDTSSGNPPVMRVQDAQPIMDKIRTMLQQANRLDGMLKTYDAATTPSDKQTQAQQVLQVVSALTQAATDIGLPNTIGSEAVRLVNNLNTTLTTIKLSISAQGMQS